MGRGMGLPWWELTFAWSSPSTRPAEGSAQNETTGMPNIESELGMGEDEGNLRRGGGAGGGHGGYTTRSWRAVPLGEEEGLMRGSWEEVASLASRMI